MTAVCTAYTCSCVSWCARTSESVDCSNSSSVSSIAILSAPRGVRVEELGFCPAGGQAPDAAERLASVLSLVLAYALFLVAAALALSAFFVGRPAAALIAIAVGVVALWLVLEGESALDAQALDEIEGQ